MGDVRSDNTSDKAWNLEMLTEIQESFLDPQKIICVADSSLVTPDNLDVMARHRMRFISRLPESYNLAAELKERAWSKGVWQRIGRLAQNDQGAIYHTQSFTETLEGRPYRFVVVHSSSKDARKAKAIEKQLAAELLQLQKEQKELEKHVFSCREDADRALKAFLSDHARSAHRVTGVVNKEETVIRKPGRPAKDAAPPTRVQYRIALNIAAPDEKTIDELHARAGAFVLITSLQDQQRWPDHEIVREYKGQTAVETRFRNLKSNPCIVDAIYVKSSRRAEALAYLFSSRTDRRCVHRDQDPSGAYETKKAVSHPWQTINRSSHDGDDLRRPSIRDRRSSQDRMRDATDFATQHRPTRLRTP